MIIDVKKYLFIGAKEDLDDFFEKAQNQGFIEFIPPSGRKPIELPEEAQNLQAAIKILRKLPVKKPYLGGGSAALALETARRILTLNAEIERIAEEQRILEAEIVRVSPFGDFSMDDIDFIERVGKRKIQFFAMKTAKSHKTNFPPEVIYINTIYDLDYFIAINPEPKIYPDMIEMRIDRPLGQLQNHLAFAKESLHLLEAELKGFAGHIDFLYDALLGRLNEYNLIEAKREVNFPLEHNLFSIEAWIPINKINHVFGMLNGMAIHAEEILVEEHDRVPTYMENKGVNRIGEDLVKIYDIPSPKDKDPSGWVFWSFIVFFAIIVSDAGYGVIFLALALYLRFKNPKFKGPLKRIFTLIVALSVSCIAWGILTAEYFGLELSPHNPVSHFSLLDYLAKKKAAYHMAHHDDVYQHWLVKIPNLSTAHTPDQLVESAKMETSMGSAYEMFDDFKDNILLEFSLFLGVIHISLSLLRYLRRHWAAIGWVVFLVGGYLYFPHLLKATSSVNFLGILDKAKATVIGLQLIYCGIGLAIVLAFIQERFKGLTEAGLIIKIFGDTLSYLRLYALSLATIMMASTFNDLGKQIGLAFGGFIVLLGQLTTIGLGIMAGMIHGLRLNFIEWYHYSFEGGGRLFNPLKKFKTE